MKRVYLVRHGQTTYNRDQLVQDGNSLLTELGHRQAEMVAERLQNLDFNHLIVSDYERTKQTAVPTIEKLNLEPIYSELFREGRRPSRFWHKPRDTEYRSYIEEANRKAVEDPGWHDSDEENFNDLYKRAKEALDYLVSLDGDCAVISHGRFIQKIILLVATKNNLDPVMWHKMIDAFLPINTGITTLEYDEAEGYWRIITFNDIAHFAE